MVQIIESRNREAGTSEHPVHERRRPGRRDFKNPALIALLRQNEQPHSRDARKEMFAIGVITSIFIAALMLGGVILLALFN
jgi:hypothetical protein